MIDAPSSFADRRLIAAPALVAGVVATPEVGAVFLVDAGIDVGPAVDRLGPATEVEAEPTAGHRFVGDRGAIGLIGTIGRKADIVVGQLRAGESGPANTDFIGPTIGIARA